MAQIGVKKLMYSLLTKDDETGVTYAPPVLMSPLITVDVKPNPNMATLYGDDAPKETAGTLGEIDVTLDTTDLKPEIEAALLGATIDKATGQLISKGADEAPYVGLIFQSKKSDGAIRYIKLLKGKFSPYEENLQTKGANVQFQTPKISGKFVARLYDDQWKRAEESNQEGVVSAVIAAWYDAMEYVATP